MNPLSVLTSLTCMTTSERNDEIERFREVARRSSYMGGKFYVSEKILGDDATVLFLFHSSQLPEDEDLTPLEEFK